MADVTTITTTLAIISGILWTYTYLHIIYRGFKDRACGMPLWALCLNMSWEFIFSFVIPSGDLFQEIINITWLGFDGGILLTYLLYEKRNEEDERFKGKFFYIRILIILVTSFFIVLTFPLEFPYPKGGIDGGYAAYAQNLIMSILFVQLYLKRGSRAQSWKIALAKFLGTFIPSFSIILAFPESFLLLFCAYASVFFDVIYLVLLLRDRRQKGSEQNKSEIKEAQVITPQANPQVK